MESGRKVGGQNSDDYEPVAKKGEGNKKYPVDF